ncbi:hypothetical protein FK216_11935 [Moraxellaceae bacterium AER2_44_116]|nr:hypothetical protein FK216_11935 [Moraxellaceae bacterium AER2_44_116]
MTSKDGLSEVFYKIGVAQDVDKRFNFGKKTVLESNLSLTEKLARMMRKEKYVSDFPYNYEKIHSVEYKYEGDALIAEKSILDIIKKYQYWPKEDFSGKSECVSCDASDVDEFKKNIIKHMDADSSEREKNAPNQLLYNMANNKTSIREQDKIKRHLLVLDECKKIANRNKA